METLFGLPAHSLLVHAPIVLLPVAAIATIVMAVRPSWRARAHWWMVAVLFSVVAMVYLAKDSGEAFEAAFEGAVDVDRHSDLANTTFILTLLWFVAYAALVGYEFAMRRTARSAGAAARDTGPMPAVSHSLAALAAVLAVLATIWLIRTGHEGTDVVWGDTTDQIFGG